MAEEVQKSKYTQAAREAKAFLGSFHYLIPLLEEAGEIERDVRNMGIERQQVAKELASEREKLAKVKEGEWAAERKKVDDALTAAQRKLKETEEKLRQTEAEETSARHRTEAKLKELADTDQQLRRTRENLAKLKQGIPA